MAMGYNLLIKTGLMLLLTTSAPSTPNLIGGTMYVPATLPRQPSLFTSLCRRCQAVPLPERTRGPRFKYCNECRKEVARERDRERYKQPERNKQTRQRVAQWAAGNAEYVRQQNQARYIAHKNDYNAACRLRYHNNKSQYVTRAKEYRQSHQSDIKARRVRYKQERAEAIRASRRRYYEENRERLLARNKEYRKAHPEVKQVCEARRHARKKGACGIFGVRQWRAIRVAYGHICLRCLQSKPLTVDHVVPVSKGGLDCVCNIQPLCLECNVKKHARTIDYRLFIVAIPCPHRERVA